MICILFVLFGSDKVCCLFPSIAASAAKLFESTTLFPFFELSCGEDDECAGSLESRWGGGNYVAAIKSLQKK